MNNITKYQFKNIKKIGVGIMGFEGSEHIYNIISEIKDLIDFVMIGALKFSYHNEPISKTDEHIINTLYAEGLIDVVEWYELDSTKEPRKLEVDKRNNMLQYMLENEHCSHILIIDADEYYNHDTFLEALKKIDENDYDITYCQYINYYKDYMHYLKYPFKQGMYVPFIAKSSYRFKYDCTDFRYPSDPTRRYVRLKDNNNFIDSMYIFEWSELKMHHLSWIRNNIHGKLSSWSAKKVFKNVDNLIDKALYDYYHFNDDCNKVHLIFNTPDNTVEVGKFNKQYINPKKDITEYKVLPEYKKILVLNMSSTALNNLYEELEQTCRETWAFDILNKKYSNIEYYSVTDTKGDTHIDLPNHKVYVHINETDDNISSLTYRFQVAYELLKKQIKYDYVVKTNTSTWLNIEAINELLGQNFNDTYIFGFRIEQAFWSTFNLYMQGNFTIFSNRTLDILFSIIDAGAIREILDIADDNYIGAYLSNRLTTLNIPQIEHLVALPCYNFYMQSLTLPYNCIDNYAVQVKTYDSEFNSADRFYYDKEKMKIIHQLYLNNKSNYSSLLDILKNKTLNIVIHLIPYIKKDWLTLDNTTKQKLRFKVPKIYKSWNECHTDIIGLRKLAGYIKNNK